MAKVIQRVWKSGPRKVRRTGYTFQRDGKPIRKYNASWSREDAENALGPPKSVRADRKPTSESG
jgi:hypothetical protein